MSGFKNNLNMFLTTLLIIVLIGLVILTVYFQTSLNKFNQKYNEKDDEVDKLRLELLQYKESAEELNKTVKLLNVDLVEYTEEFELTHEQLSHERNQILINLNNTQEDLRLKEIELQNKNNKLKNLKNNIIILNTNITQIEEEIKSPLDNINKIDEDSEKLYDYINNNYDQNMTINQCLNVLSNSEEDSEDISTRARKTNNELNKVETMIKSIKEKFEQTYILLEGY